MNQVGKYILAAFLLLGGSIGLSMTLCGAVFSVTGIGGIANGGGDLLLISVPSAGAGIALLYAVVRRLKELFNNAQEKADGPTQ